MRSSTIPVTTTSSSSLSSNLSKKYLGSGFFGGVNKRNPNWVSNGFLRISRGNLSLNSPLRSSRLVTCCSTEAEAGKSISTSKSMNQGGSGAKVEMGANGFFLRENGADSKFTVGVGSPKLPTYFPLQKLSLNDQVFFLMAFIACTTSLAFASLVAAAVPTLYGYILVSN